MPGNSGKASIRGAKLLNDFPTIHCGSHIDRRLTIMPRIGLRLLDFVRNG